MGMSSKLLPNPLKHRVKAVFNLFIFNTDYFHSKCID